MNFPPADTILHMDVRPGTSAVEECPPRCPPEDQRTACLTPRLVAGEEEAWREFHACYFERLLRYLLVVCRGDEQAARESLQAALVKIVRYVRRFDREAEFWSWLTVIARSCVIDRARGHSRYRNLLATYARFLTTGPERPCQDVLPDLLADCIREMPAAEAALLVAKYEEGQSIAELAASLGCTHKAVESRLARLRHRVKSQLLQRLRHEN